MKLLSVKIERLVDESPDTSCLGRYTDCGDAGRGEIAIDRKMQGDWSRGECRYAIVDREYAERDYDRLEALSRGDWCYVGVQAVAEVRGDSGLMQRIESAGLWGIESDSDESYIADIVADELAHLRDELVSFGVECPEVLEEGEYD